MSELFFSEKHYALQEDLREFLLKELEPIKKDISNQKKIPLTLIKNLGKKGLFGPLIPEKYDGTELGMVAHCLITEEISRVNVAVSVT